MSQEQHDRMDEHPAGTDEREEPTRVTGTPEGEVVPETGRARTDNERLDDTALRFMADAAYAVAGFAGLVGERARAFYDEQRAEYAKAHPDVESPGAKEFLEQLGSHLNRFVDEINRGFRDLSDKGREVMNNRPVNPEADKTGSTDPGGREPKSAAPETAEPEAGQSKPAEPNSEEYGEEYRQPGNE